MFGMKETTQTWKLIVISAFVGFSLLSFTGCSEKSDDSTTLTADEQAAAAGDEEEADALAAQDAIEAADATKTYTGDRTLTGTVDTSTLSSSDRTLLLTSGRDRSRSTTVTASGTETVKLYVVGGDGALKDTGITCTVSSGSYSCANIEGGIDYVVRYVKQLDNGKVLDMRSTATVPTDTDPAPVKVDPITTMVAEAVVQAVSEAITGLISNESLVQSIITSVKTAVETTMTTLIQTGVISIPSMVEDGDLADIAAAATENENLASATGAVLTDNTVNDALTSTRTEALASTVTLMSKRQVIQTIFDQMMKGDGGAPKWMINFIGDNWNSVTSTMTFAWLQTEISNSLTTAADPDSEDTWALDELERMGVADPTTLLTNLKAAVQTAMTDGTALTGAIDAISEYHTVKAIAADSRTEAQKEFLSEFPAIVGELFPQTFLDSATAATTFQNSGQLTAYLIYLVDIFVRDVTEQFMASQSIDVLGDQARNMHLVNFEDPSFLFIDLGFDEAAAVAYGGLYFEGWADIKSNKVWNTDGTTSQILELNTGVENPAWFFNPITADKVTAATLTYPNDAGTTTTVDLDFELHDGEFVDLRMDGYICDETTNQCDPNPNGITDHASGDYVVSVTINGVTATKTFKNVIVLTDTDAYRPKLTTPREFPYCTDGMTDQECMDLWTAFDNAGGVSVLRPNVDTNADDVNDSLEGAVFKWTAPDVTALSLPDTVKVAYQISISRYQTSSQTEQEYCEQGNWDECNTEIYSSWWYDRAISGTSFTLPVTLPANSVSTDPYVSDEYNIGVNMILIDKETGQHIAEGGHTWSNFKVGEPPYTVNGTEPINFTGTITGTIPANAVVALLAESNEYNSTSGEWEWSTEVVAFDNTVTGGTYELNTTVAAIKAQIAENRWFSIILIKDDNTDNDWTPWTPDAVGEDAWWMHDQWFWFETWGDFRVAQDDPSGNYNSQTVNDASGATLTGLDITIQ